MLETTISHLKSDFVGLNRKVTLYTADGQVMRTWEGNFKVEDQGGSFRFIDEGRAITVSGTVVIEES
ncbi:MAG TPA: hypothetical protein VD994_18010 [Prosthecobacter sp.]|nr:hypothetical protein [Prosthecobacter sp.]